MQYNNMDFKVQGPQIHQFNDIQARPNPIPRSSFDRSYTHRTTLDTDYLYPIFVDEILPGDDVHISMQSMVRLTTPIKPIMDNLYCETFWFFVPYRLVFSQWEQLQGQQVNPGDSTDVTLPKFVFDVTTKGFSQGGVADYFGLPTASTIDFTVNDPEITTMYHTGYRLIWNEWFRDESLLNSVTINIITNENAGSGYDNLLKRGKRKDYFTSALPWAQKASPVTVNIGGTAPVVFPTGISVDTLVPSSVGTVPAHRLYATTTGDTGAFITGTTTHASAYAQTITGLGPSDSYADLAAASGITINDFRQAALYQQIYELDARGGTRYVESIYSRFGVVSPDFRLQRPELIGLGQTAVNVYAVPQTSASPSTPTSNDAQGNLAAFGTSISKGHHQAKYAAQEHGMIIGLMNIRADLTYQQGLPKMFTRSTRLDFYEPLLNGLGEQAILNKEIYAQGTAADDQVFGYQERFSEYKQRPSMITNKFRSTDPQSLDVWHLSQDFGSLPILGSSSFIEEAVPMDRVVAVTTEPKFYCDMWFKYTHVRPMPMRSTPGIDIL